VLQFPGDLIRLRMISQCLENRSGAAGLLRFCKRLQAMRLNSSLKFLAGDWLTLPESHRAATPSKSRLEPELRLAAYRVIEEAISNSLEHGQASKVIVRLELANADLRLSVRDDGHGFEVGAIKPGLGFATTEARVSVMNGFWTLESGPTGTTMTAVFAISSHH
jgi:signal transduction histidine kinase